MIEVENTLITGFDKPDELKEVKPLDLAVEVVERYLQYAKDDYNELAHQIAKEKDSDERVSLQTEYEREEAKIEVLMIILEQIK